MIKKKESKLKNIIEYVIIIATFYVTGGAFSYIHYSLQIIIFFLMSLLLCVLYKKNILEHANAVLTLIIMSLFVLIPCLLFADSITTYIAIIMQLCIGFFCATLIPIENYKKKFVNVIVWFACVSLIGFVAGMLNPSIALRFPLIDTVEDASVVYYNAYVYIFMAPKWYGGTVLTVRNAGICWEPGCYQMFLNIALLFLLTMKDDKKNKHFYLKFLILIITIITTISTTGYILMIIILIAMRKSWISNLKSLLVLPIILCAVVVSLKFFSAGEAIIGKIKREFFSTDSSSQNFLNRISFECIPYIFTDSYFLGMGFSKWLTFEHALWNSIIHSFLCLGTPFTLMQLYGLFKGSKAFTKRYLILFIVIVACASTETLFWRVLFNTFAFYGRLNINNYSKATQELNNENFNNRCSNIERVKSF